MKPWIFPTIIGVLQIGAGVVYLSQERPSLGVFYILCAASNAALTFLP